MSQINLLPKDKRGRKSATKLKKRLEISLAIFIAIFLISLTSAFLSVLFLNNKLSDLKTNLDTVENEVNELSRVEDKTVFLRDRIEKYNLIKEENSEIETIQIFDKLASDFPDDVEFGSLTIEGDTIGFSINIQSLQSLSYLLELIESSGKYDYIKINKLSINNEDFRYTLILTMTGTSI